MTELMTESRRVKASELLPAKGERAMFVGQTGSGKTTLARVLLETRRYVVVLDNKGMLKWPDYHVHKTLDDLAKDKHPRLIYRPSWVESTDPIAVEDFFAWVYLRRHCTCYIDELMSLDQRGGDNYPPHFGACLTRGRELGIELWSATQRPKRVPQVSISEAEHVYAFHLKLPQDRDRVAELTGMESDRIAALPKFDFLYSRQDAPTQGPLRLKL